MTMENNQNTTQQQIAQQGAPTQPEDNGSTEKVFTQEDVNRIVQERLARDRESRNASQQAASDDAARLADLERRENTLSCREYIAENGYSKALLDVFSTDNADAFKGSVDALHKAFPGLDLSEGSRQTKPLSTGMSHEYGSECWRDRDDDIASAFKPKY